MNEIVELLAYECLWQIVADGVKSLYFAVIADETTDQSHKEQVSICLRYVETESLQPVGKIFL